MLKSVSGVLKKATHSVKQMLGMEKGQPEADDTASAQASTPEGALTTSAARKLQALIEKSFQVR